jgi:uncharacterized protein (TIGR00730 family)
MSDLVSRDNKDEPRRPLGQKPEPRKPLTASASDLEAHNAPLKPNITLNRASRIGAPTEDEQLLQKPSPAPYDFTRSDTWRVLRIMGEFVSGFDTLANVGAAVTIFGSARINEQDPMYGKAMEIAKQLAEEGFAIITGGGPGIMEAANRGAKEAGGMSIGCNIELPFEQGTNAYVDIAINFRYFFVRKTMFMKYSEAFVIFPGGFGTMDELFEALTLIQTGKVRNFPLILFGTHYWKGLIDWIKGTMLPEKKISPDDLNLLVMTDSVDEACKHIIDCYNDRCWRAKESSEASKIQSELLDDPGTLHPPTGNGNEDEEKVRQNGRVQTGQSNAVTSSEVARPGKGDAQ